MFLSEGPDALVALGHALWLGVTFPIDPEITVAMLQHLVEESPEEADTRNRQLPQFIFLCKIKSSKCLFPSICTLIALNLNATNL
jgi:hypothetical protein